MLNGSRIVITGGSGSFGKEMAKRILRDFTPDRLTILSRGEKAQTEMKSLFAEDKYPRIQYLLGDVRDVERLRLAFYNTDYVIHAAAQKEIDSCERDPREAIMTNVLGALNVQRAAIDCGVRKVVALSTDKASSPITTYGATKLLSDKSFIRGNVYAGSMPTRFSVVRYGNVAASRGSVIPRFIEQKDTGTLTITDLGMTRFWLSMEDAINAVLFTLENMRGGECVVPKMPSFFIKDLAKAIAPNARYKVTGVRGCEKLHEQMWAADEASDVLEYEKYYVLYPASHEWAANYGPMAGGERVAERFCYSSDANSEWLNVEQIRKKLVNMEVTP
jgi:UDP-N-acetylglucosamine 4,6-dehydratase